MVLFFYFTQPPGPDTAKFFTAHLLQNPTGIFYRRNLFQGGYQQALFFTYSRC